jgi:hypothetical protein
MSRETRDRTRLPVEPRLNDKRKEPRWPARGNVKLIVDDRAGLEIDGQLVDVSASGFRAAHTHPGLSNGQTVQFQHSRGAGQARVVWNRIIADQVETGFLVL